MFFTKERLARWLQGATILSLLAVPIVLGFAQQQTAKESLRREYMQLALEVLRDPNRLMTADQLALRRWSIDIVKEFTPVDLPAETLAALQRGALAPTPKPATGVTVQ